VLQPSLPVVWLLALAWVYTVLNLAHVFLYTSSRVILAWVKDRIVSQGVGYIHPELKSPVITVLLVCILAELGVVDAALNGSLFLRFNPLYFMVSVQMIPVAAVVLLPYLRPDWFASTPEIVRRKLGPIPLISLTGLVTLVYMVFMLVANTSTGLFGGIGMPTITLATVFYGTGLIWFYGRRYYQMTQGKEFDRRFNNLPQD
jgi:basic amino acid/polyamine antiporter, APA family